MSRAAQWFAGLNFAALLGGVIVFLWHADSLPLAQAGVWFAALSAGLWAVGAVTQGRITMLEVLLIEAAALATATSAAGLLDLHRVFKPLTMLIAIFMIAAYDPSTMGSGQKDSHFPQNNPAGRFWLLAALAGSLAGDVFLMLQGYFIPGLVAFLLAHVAYIVMLRQGVAWFPSRRALAATLGVGAAMYAFLWTGGLPAGLRVPVAAYVTVIALMTAQAIGRATVLRDKASTVVAVGAGCFMLSDSLLATNKFVQPLPLAQFWVLSSYYAAQILIVGGWMRGRPRPDSSAQVSPESLRFQ
jgi:alkylglycerol monooxygenase